MCFLNIRCDSKKQKKWATELRPPLTAEVSNDFLPSACVD